ncbi:MAG: hypothetical protein ACLFM0_02340 [Spirochaetales bacterium]
MLVVLASESKSTASYFRPLDRSSEVEFLHLSRDEVRKWVRERIKRGERRSECLVYVDVVGLDAAERKRLIRYLLKYNVALIGICDPVQDVEDPALWFHAGVLDYLPAPVLEDGVKPSRVKTVAGIAQSSRAFSAREDTMPSSREDASEMPATDERRIPSEAPADLVVKESPNDWSYVEIGSEYTFGILHVALDIAPTTLRDASADLITYSIGAFQDALMEVIGPYGGRLWFWKEYSGVILFPYNGVRCEAITAGMRIMLRRIFWQAERKTNAITKHFRMSLHVGNLVYREGGDRETLVSDLVNYLFHLGTKFTNPGEFVFTADIGHCCPAGLRPYFVYQGSYRSHEIWRMKRLRTPREVSAAAATASTLAP